MVLDINLFRAAKYARDQLSKQLNAASKQLALHHKAGKSVAEDQAVARRLKTELEQANQQAVQLQAQRDSALQAVGNLVHHSVPHHREEAHNQVISTGGPPPRTCGPEAALLAHAELLQRLGLADLEAGATAAGSRAYFLLNEGVLLNQVQASRLVSSPAKGRPPATAATPLNGGPLPAELEAEEDGSGSSRYLIATSEQALCALHQGSWLEPQDLPLRVHQFDKVEQFAITAPGQPSWDMLDRMVQTAQDFYTSLQLPHRSVRVVSGALNLAAAAKVDVEAWFPASGTYRELVSASNCTDYQARRLDIRLRSAGA
ncbi:AA_TRNA_LIGASE_II domain-containing protein, partial [Haematococcus lacustris]